MKIRNISDWQKINQKALRELFPDSQMRLSVGLASCGIAAGAGRVYETLQKEIKRRELAIQITKTGCLGFCGEEPMVNFYKPGFPLLILHRITEKDAEELVEVLARGEIPEKKVLGKIEEIENFFGLETINFGKGLKNFPHLNDLPFYRKQKKIVLRDCGFIDPENIEEFIAVGGFLSLLKVLTTLSPAEVIEMVKDSGLRGRGGAGFPTGIKWEIARNIPSEKKYIICNADEGDPGAYMNRNEMESDPYMLIEGMIIGGYAIGADEGIIYVRTEYPLAIERVKKALAESRKYGFLGKGICNSKFNFEINIVCGAGAFVCGEETALIASIEGYSGRPRPRPPFPAEKGLNGEPTVINNVETWCTIPVIIAKGAGWFNRFGTERSPGTKVFSLVGAVKNVGLVEVPMGITLKEIIYEMGGGGIKERKIKAVQTGGPSGGCIPASLFDLSVDYEGLQKSGSIMGSGGMVVMDERTCMVDITKYFLSFTQEESCGKCIPCRRGLEYMLNILEEICEGRGKMSYIDELQEIALIVKQTSLCGLGQTAPNPVLSTIRYFRQEYEAHILDHNCPAGVCKPLIKYFIDPTICTGCQICRRICPTGAVSGEKKQAHAIDIVKCIKCGACFDACKFNAVKVE
jgi:NADH:ubiquinone oxidoreductase subunit F (NADH-binding)/(2Fe-2S) ferredoxin/NAD-dependent dihydropyrimidine dehydrogenase PreA subunit